MNYARPGSSDIIADLPNNFVSKCLFQIRCMWLPPTRVLLIYYIIIYLFIYTN